MKLKWLKRKPKEDAGVTWGIPWKQGNLDREESLILKGDSGTTFPLQTWPLAFWPDGSVKWTGHSAVLRGEIDSYKIERGNAQVQSNDVINLVETDESIEIDNGAVTISLLKQGQHLIETICSGNQLLANNGKLIAIHEKRSSSDGMNVKEEEELECIIESVEVEQKGTVRCVIKFTGIFSKKDKVKLLPFSLRLYIYAGTMEMKVVHTFFYDGNPEKDFVKGLGIEFSVPIQGDPWNRHVRIAGDQGIYNEPGQLLKTRRHWDANGLYEKQINGDMVNLTAAENKTLIDHVKQNAIWNDFKISQDSANHYCFSKRTNDRQANVEGIHGKRALGFAYIGGERGGLAIGIKDFWQKHPTSLEANHLTKENSKIKAWFWSPDAEAMDLRHYSDKTYETSAYEGFEEMRATPFGIANTSELFIQCYQEIPSNDDLLERAQEWQTTRLLVCEPEYYYESKTAGIWSLPDETNPVKAKIEKQLNHAIEFYQNEIEQRSWYGYWNYGDVMHTYDAVRHQWLYDLGGYAWQNTELVPNLWLWHAFLRSGREDIFRMAEAMTRHTSEVDCYHFGEYQGLGSRHNVSHWGCGCKEVRISMAGLHEYYYYLTVDERIGDRLSEVRDAEYALERLDPLRAYYPDDKSRKHARTGPDWSALCSNWLIEWERTENPVYLNKILTGIEQFKQFPMRLLSGHALEYEPKKNKFSHIGDATGSYHMVIAFGAPQTWIEIAELIDDPVWEEMIVEFGEYYGLENEEKQRRSNNILSDRHFHHPMMAVGMIAYAAMKKADEKLAKKAWEFLLDEDISKFQIPFENKTIDVWTELKEIQRVSTNTTAQWCLNTMMALELIGEHLTEDMLQKYIYMEV